MGRRAKSEQGPNDPARLTRDLFAIKKKQEREEERQTKEFVLRSLSRRLFHLRSFIRVFAAAKATLVHQKVGTDRFLGVGKERSTYTGLG